MNNEFTRSNGIIPNEYIGYGANINHFHSSGGLNLRGYSGYLAPEGLNGIISSYNYSGISGGAINAELDFSNYMPYFFSNKINSYVFADAGTITNDKINKDNFRDIFTDLRIDAGIGFETTLRFNPTNLKPLILRLDLPLFLNRRPANNDEFIQMRWLIGINRVI